MQIIISDESYQFLKDLSKELKEQDNCSIDEPYYYTVRVINERDVRQNKTQEFRYLKDGYIYTFNTLKEVLIDELTDEEILHVTEIKEYEELKEFFYNKGIDLQLDYDVEEIEVEDYYKDHNIFLTKKAYEDHMKVNGHNYYGKAVYPYVHHAFRNNELKRLLEIIKEIE